MIQSDKSIKLPPFIEIKNQNPHKNKKTPNISKEVFDEMMNTFKDKEDDENLLYQIGEKIAENMLPISSDSPFADTDMVVFKDNYRGYLPPNGMRESDLKLISKLYTDIASNTTNIKITSEFPSYPSTFQKEVLLSIKTLLTREIGRKLVNKVIDLKKPIEIIAGNIDEARTNKIHLNIADEPGIINIHPSGRLTHSKLPGFLTLGHEMIHVVHMWENSLNTLQPPTLDLEGGKYDDLEEQITITGLKNILNTKFNEDVDDWEPINHDYDELNERNLTAAFTGSLTEYYSKEEKIRFPRVGHHSINTSSIPEMIITLISENVLYDLEKLIKEKSITKESLNSLFTSGQLHAFAMEKGRFEALKLLMTIDPNPITQREETLNAYSMVRTLVHSKCFLNLIKEKSITKEILNSIFYPGELHAVAIEWGSLEALKLLMTIDPNPITQRGESLLHIAGKLGQVSRDHFPKPQSHHPFPPSIDELHPIIDAILETVIDVNLCDLEGYAPIHYFTNLGDKTAIQKLVRKGGNISIRNKLLGTDPFDFAISFLLKNFDTKTAYEREQLKSRFRALYELMEDIYPKDELIQKIREPDFAKNFLNYADEKTKIDFVEKLIKEKSFTKESLNSMFKPGEPHALAMKHGRVETLKLLMKLNPNPLTQKGETLLHIAAKEGKNLPSDQLHSIIDAILDNGIDVNIRDLEGYTPLHYFILLELGDATAIRKLVHKGGDLIRKEFLRTDPLGFALSFLIENLHMRSGGELRVQLQDFQELMKDIYLKDERIPKIGTDPFDFALSLDIKHESLPLGALYKLMKVTYSKDELIHKIRQPKFAKIFLNYADMRTKIDYLEMLIKEKAFTKEILDSFKPGELHLFAVATGRIETLKVLNTLDPNPITQMGESLLHIAAKQGKNLPSDQLLSIIDVILETGIDVNLCDLEGYAPLHYFTELGDKTAIQKLVRKGGNIHIRNELFGTDPFDYALSLIIKNIENRIIPTSVKTLYDQLHALYQLMKDIYSKEELIQKLGETEFAKKFLNCASSETRSEYLEKLIMEKGVTKESLKSMFKQGELHAYAIESGRVEAFKLIMTLDPNPITQKGESLLHIAAKQGKNLPSDQLHSIIDAILETGMDVNLRDLKGYAPLHYFTELGDKTAIKKLVHKGGNIHVRNELLGTDPFDYALSSLIFFSKKTSESDMQKLHTLYQLMKNIYSKEELIKKLGESEFAKNFLSYADQESILNYLDVLHESDYDLTKLDEKGNTIMHYAVLSCRPTVLNKLKQEFKHDMSVMNQKGKSLSDYLIEQLPSFFFPKLILGNDEVEELFDNVHKTLIMFGEDLTRYKKDLLLICDQMLDRERGAHHSYVKTLFQFDNTTTDSTDNPERV